MHKSLGTKIRWWFTIALALMFVSGIAAAPAVAQAQSLTSALTGATVSYNSPYELQTDLGYADDIIEMFVFFGDADVVAVGFIQNSIDLSGARDILLEGFFSELGTTNTLDRGEYEGVSYSLDLINADGQEFAVFTLFVNNSANGFAQYTMFIAPPSLFEATMRSAQGAIAINGEPILNGVDAASLAAMVTANIGTTGGATTTNVTNVTDVTPTPVTQQTGSNDAEVAAYLQAVRAEYATAETSLATILETLSGMNDGSVAAADATPIFTEQSEILAGTSTRAAAITAPAGLEDFHQDFLSWAAAVTDAGEAWTDFASGAIESDAYITSLETALGAQLEFGDTLDAATAGSTTPTDPTPAPTETTTTSDADVEAYLATIDAQRTQFRTSFGNFNDNLALVVDGVESADDQAAAQVVVDEASSWLLYADTANAITPPAGYEGVHAAYLDWANSVTALGAGWIGVIGQDGVTTFDDVDAALDDVVAAETALDVAIADASAGGTTVEPTTAPTEVVTNNADAETYLAAIADHRAAFATSMGVFNDNLAIVTDGVESADDSVAAQAVLDEVAGWLTYADTAAQLTPPPGYEGVQAAYEDWANAIVAFGTSWTGFISQDGTTIEQVQADLDAVGSAETALDVAIADAEGAAVTTDVTPVPTEATTTRTTRTTRTTAAETPTPTETTTRTTRTTRTDVTPTEVANGNTSETRGTTRTTGTTTTGTTRTTRTTTSAAETVTLPTSGMDAAWGEGFDYYEGDEASSLSTNAETGEDQLLLGWESPNGSTVQIFIGVAPSVAADASVVVNSLATNETDLEELFGAGAEVVDSVVDPEASGIVIRAEDEQGEYYLYIQYTCVDASCDTIARMIIATDGESLPLVLADMESGVVVNDLPISDAIPVADVEAATLGQ